MPAPARPSGRPLGPAVRALLAVALLAGFYLLALGVIAAVVGTDIVLAENSSRPFGLGGLKLYLLSSAVVYPVLRVVFLSRPPAVGRELPGLPVTPGEQPALWARVHRLAKPAGTRPPAELRLTADVNAAVTEQPRLLGLLPGRRTMLIGVPLLIGLSEAELDAVLAHELGHYSNQDTRLGGLTYAGRQALAHSTAALEMRAGKWRAERQQELDVIAAARRAKGRRGPRKRASGGVDALLARLFAAYAKLYFRVSESVGRRQEYAADLTAARLAGPDAMAAALRRLPALEAALDHYLAQYALIGWEAGLLPPPGEVFGGLAHLLADPRRQAELAELEPPDEDPHPYDSHPPLAARIAAMAALPSDGRGPDTSGPALGLLARPTETLAAVEAVTLASEAAGMTRLDWPELALHACLAEHTPRAGALRAAVPESWSWAGALTEVLDAVAVGRWWELAAHLPRTEQAEAATGRAARELARPAFRAALRDLLILALAEAGAADCPLSWSEPVRMRLPAGLAGALPPALDAALAEPPDVRPLRALVPTY